MTMICLMQVETIGDGYMVVVGIPNTQERHAEYAADMAIDMLIGLKKVELPFLEGKITVKLGSWIDWPYFYRRLIDIAYNLSHDKNLAEKK